MSLAKQITQFMHARSETGDVEIVVASTGVRVTLLGHRWSVGLHPGLGLTVLPVGLNLPAGHKRVTHPRDCPGCREFVAGLSLEQVKAVQSKHDPKVMP